MTRRISRRRFLARLGTGALSVASVAGGGIFAAVGGAREASACVRPPGALPEEEFLSTCIRCGRCADACPNRCITAFTPGAGRELSLTPSSRQLATPVIFPRRQACILCNGEPGTHLLCTGACPTGALTATLKSPESVLAKVRMGTAQVDTNLCYSFNGASCGVCVRACPFEGKALKAGLWERPLIDPEVCVGCGLCERSCIHYPQAIRIRPAAERKTTL